MSKYLYGAAVQGIQNFIFQTNKLQEIIGASELVEQVCTSKFAEMFGKKTEDLAKDPNAIVNAAGNIKYIFDDFESCQRIVRAFPKIIIEHAPGITISQSVVEYPTECVGDFENAVLKLEETLRSQRNKPSRSPTIGLMGIERSRQTGLPVIVSNKENEHMDAATYKKLYDDKKRRQTTLKLCKDAFGDNVEPEQIAYNIEDMTGDNDWIAIIHADGNGLGQVVQKMGTEEQKFKAFSLKLDAATKQTARDAFTSLNIILDGKKQKRYPIRPIVLSGDDHTLICRADLAILYVKTFIEKFEKYTGDMLADELEGVFADGSKFLSACAGIAFIKSSYPFYFGYQLAEELCGVAKKDTKAKYDFDNGNLPASCIMFHKVQDSFMTNYDDIVKRELSPNKDYSLKFGPYYSKASPNDRWTIEKLTTESEKLSHEDMQGVKTGLRQWLTAVTTDPANAYQRMERLKAVSKQDEFLDTVYYDWEKQSEKRFPIYDILVIDTINNQKTR